MHYKAMPDSAKVLGREDMMLLDSGGQYLDGTTDVTRTSNINCFVSLNCLKIDFPQMFRLRCYCRSFIPSKNNNLLLFGLKSHHLPFVFFLSFSNRYSALRTTQRLPERCLYLKYIHVLNVFLNTLHR